MAKHGIFESTKLYGCMNVSFVADVDMDNGSIVGNEGLADGYTDVYKAKVPAKDEKIYIVGHPAYGHNDIRVEEINDDEYTNEAGKIFRTYELIADRKFKVSSDMIQKIDPDTELAKGQYVAQDGTTYKLKAFTNKPTDTNFVGVIESVEETGFPYFGSSKGVQVTDMGYVLDTRIVKVKIRVLKNND